jgi:hypothetical protein
LAVISTHRLLQKIESVRIRKKNVRLTCGVYRLKITGLFCTAREQFPFGVRSGAEALLINIRGIVDSTACNCQFGFHCVFVAFNIFTLLRLVA